MQLHNLSHAKELISVAKEIGITLSILSGKEADAYIFSIFEKYKPWKIEGHLSIGNGSNTLTTENNEFSFSLSMRNTPAFIFFEQNYINKSNIVIIENAQDISRLMKHSHGMEYFISDEYGTYLIAVNWYSIEFIGNVNLN